ncbi:nitrate- and nitrite sensing domain-containing protein [Streptomyces sp. ACA25]|uniref:sensor histidine kinase n=1 Tax=Streptomyces sp. ACA25 TaxID=3022596 RepID=UPI00230762BB|nr:sensor histidine kinase [Streptomyces sp. ACA25]MDB1088397.1 nitrate- and nitrite sensing domain-containing protein [Streptomyces sp. ACA25]
MQGRFKREGSAAGDAELGGATGRSSPAGHADDGEPSQAGVTVDRTTPDEPGGEAGQSDAPEKSGGPQHAGSRMALRNWRISTRLVSLIALPVVAATVLGGFRIQQSMENVEQLDNMQLLTDMTQQATRLAVALQEERDRSAGPLVSGRSPKSDDVVAPRERTDAARQAFADATFEIDTSDEVLSGINSRVLSIGRQLNEIKEIRDTAYEDPLYLSQTVTRYNQLIESLLSLSQDMAQATSNAEMIQNTRALAAFSSAKENASIQRAVITGGLARGERDDDEPGLTPSDWTYGKSALNNEKAAMSSFVQLYGDEARVEELLEPLEGGIVNIVSANQYAQTVFNSEDGITTQFRTYKDWYDLNRTKIEAMDNIEQTLLAEMEEQARTLRDDAQRDAILNGAIILLVLGISLVGAFVVARSMVRSLRRLQYTAQQVAHKRLPEVVREMSEADPQDVDTNVQSVGVHTRDEIGQVAQAFDEVHREAVRLAGEQALLRGNVNAMFTNLSRRSQGLVQRQLSLISELESREADPDQLENLFKLDHLATRMRRNGENLLVLAGEEPGRRWTRPVPLVDVLRAAASEVEQYERIELSAVPKSEVAGRVVNDLVHLLAELLENATSFSSPQTKVKVTGHALPDGRVLVEIHDTGIGLSPEDLAEINERLANPPTVDVSVSRRMGLFVVGRLSLRHGIRIQLRPSDSGGTTALVMLPAEVAQGGKGKPAGSPSRNAGQASATLQREAPAPRHQQQDAGRMPPGPSRGQVPATPSRPALPSRPGAEGGPGGPQIGRPGPGSRPSWASDNEETGRMPAMGGTDGPRGHDDAHSTGAFAAPGYAGPGGPRQGRPAPAAQPDPAETGSFARPADLPGPARPGDGGQFTGGRSGGGGRFGGGQYGSGQYGGGQYGSQDTGEFPAQQPQDTPRDPGGDLPPAAPRYDGGGAPERTPIFEQMETAWFTSRRAAQPAAPAREPADTPPAPQRPTAPTPRPDQQAEAVPPAPPQRRPTGENPAPQGSAPAAPEPQWRSSPNDERWRQAEQLRRPAAGGVTTSGLPRRVPRANLVAGTAQQESAPTGPQVSRAPDDIRGRLTNLRRGIQQGRRAGSAADGTDRGASPTYQQER